jgi:hypothetical protein
LIFQTFQQPRESLAGVYILKWQHNNWDVFFNVLLVCPLTKSCIYYNCYVCVYPMTLIEKTTRFWFIAVI